MAMTATERKRFVEELAGEWWTLAQRIPDDHDRRQFLWAVARDQLVIDPYICSLLGNEFDPAYTTVALDYVSAVVESIEGEEHREYRGSQGWEPSVEWLLKRVAEEDPDGLKTYDGLPDVAADFGEIFLAHQQAIPQTSVSDRALRRLARAWAWSTWDEPWYDVRDVIPGEDWPALVLAAIEESTTGRVEWDRVRDLVEHASVEQAIGIIKRDYAPQIRAHAIRLLARFELDELGPAIEALAEFDPQTDYYDYERRGAVGTALALRYLDGGDVAPEPVVEALGHEIAHYGVNDLEITAEALLAVDAPRRERLILNVLRTEDFPGFPRVFGVAYAAPTDEVLTEVIDQVLTAENLQEHVIDGLVGFGAAAVPVLVEALDDGDLNANQATTFIRALDQIGSPEAADALVRQTGARTKSARDAAQMALEHLGEAAVDALQAGTRASKKAIREACAALLTAVEIAGDNPIHELRARMKERDLTEVDKALAELGESTSSTGEDWKLVTAHAEWHGVLVALRVRDWFLENPSDWKHREVWRGTLQYFRRDPDIAWIAVDSFANLPPGLYNWDLDQLVDQLRVIADRAPQKTGSAIAHYLKGNPPAYHEQLLELLVEYAPDADPTVYLAAMKDSSKTIRELAIEGLTRLGPREVRRAVPLLSARTKHVRLAAAAALQRVPVPDTISDLKAALESERTADVRTAIEQALIAAGSSPFDFPAEAGEASVDDVERFLAGLQNASLPSFLALDELPPLRMRSGESLSTQARESFVNRLTKEGPDTADPVVDWVRASLDDESANAFAVAVVEAWQGADAPSKEKWAIYQQARMVDDERLNEVAPHLDDWAGESNHHLARWYLDVLYRAGTRSAHSWLAFWAQNAERSSVQSAANELIERAAEEAGSSKAAYESTLNTFIADDIADQNIPTLGLEDPIEISYGERLFEVRLDPNHKLTIRETESGKAYKRLPSPRKAETVDEEAREHYRSTRKELRRVVRDVTERLEHSMVSGRFWSRAAFEELFGNHPIMTPFGGRLVFATEDDTFFRLSEGDLLGIDWDVVELGDGTTIRIAHPLDMDEDTLEAWGEHLADGEVVQPFPQIGRQTFALDADFIDEPSQLGAATRGTMVSRLQKLGWRRGIADEGAMLYTAARLFAGHRVRAWIEHDGYYVADPGWEADEDIWVRKIWFEDPLGEELKIKDVDKRVFSEVRKDLEEVFG